MYMDHYGYVEAFLDYDITEVFASFIIKFEGSLVVCTAAP